MNTVKLLENLAMKDFWADMARSLIKFDDYAHVGVIISPEQEGGRIEHRFVIWGLGRGVTNMVLLNKFQQATFALFCMSCYNCASRLRSKTSLDTVGHASVLVRRDRY